MSNEFIYVESVAAEGGSPPADSIVSRALLDANDVRVTAFSFAAGQEMLEHTSSHGAIVHVLAGEGEISLAGETRPLAPGAMVYIPANLKHSLNATGVLSFLLILIKSAHPAK